MSAKDWPPPHMLKHITVNEFRQEHGDMVERVFGHRMYDGFELEGLLNVTIQPGWRGLAFPLPAVGFSNTEIFDHKAPDGNEYDWHGAVDWMSVLLSVHWSRPVPYVYRTAIGCFDPRYSDEAGDDNVLKAIGISNLILGNRVKTKCGIYSDFIIDSAGEWGLIECFDFQFSLLVTKESLYDRFVMAFGGIDLIRARVERAVHSIAVHEAALRPERWPGGLNELHVALFRPLYEKLDWPWPFEDRIRPEAYPELEGWMRRAGLTKE